MKKTGNKYTYIKILVIFLTTLILNLIFNTETYARSGCCSWHGGVCGCDSSVGRQVCCDGTYSPSCTCARTAPSVPVTPSCGANAYYNKTEQQCYCNTGYCVGTNKIDCVKLPENARCVVSTTDAWLCNDGYTEVGNYCKKVERKIIETPLKSQENYVTPITQTQNSYVQEDMSSITDSEGNVLGYGAMGLTLTWLISLLKKKSNQG